MQTSSTESLKEKKEGVTFSDSDTKVVLGLS